MRALLIEDDPIHATLLSIWLRSLYGVGLTIESAPTFAMAKERIGERWDLIVADLRLPNGNAGPLLGGRPSILTSSIDPDEGRRVAAQLGIPFTEKGDREAFQAACLRVCPISAQEPPSSLRQAWGILSSRARMVSVAVSVLLPLMAGAGGVMFARGASAEVERQHGRDIAALKDRTGDGPGSVRAVLEAQLRLSVDQLRDDIKQLGDRMRQHEVQQAALHGSVAALLIRLGVPRDAIAPPASVPAEVP